MATPLSDNCTQDIVMSKLASAIESAIAREDALRALARRLETERDALAPALRAVLNMHAMPTKQGIVYRDNLGAMDQARAALAALDK